MNLEKIKIDKNITDAIRLTIKLEEDIKELVEDYHRKTGIFINKFDVDFNIPLMPLHHEQKIYFKIFADIDYDIPPFK